MTRNYTNVNNFIVILAGNPKRDPDVNWQIHRERGSAGGVDCVAPVETPIYAPADCVLANTPNNGTGGNTITLSFDDGWRDQMMHLSRFVTPGYKPKGSLIGYSGDSGAPGQPHVHWHRIDPRGAYFDGYGYTNRRNPWHYFTTGLAGGGSVPVDNTDYEAIRRAEAERVRIAKEKFEAEEAAYYHWHHERLAR
jgi:murein DD-endopeptidase MepM/ murein hydrolase activator NlpD